MSSDPVRRCIGCRRSDSKGTLHRFVVKDGAIVWDRNRRYPGRGAYLHPTLGCWAKAREVFQWKRALRLDGTGQVVERPLQELVDEVLAQVRETFHEQGVDVGDGPERKRTKQVASTKRRLKL